MTIIQFQKQWEAENYRIQRMPVSEWFKIFPEAESYLKYRLWRLELGKKTLTKRVEEQITAIHGRVEKFKKLGVAEARIQDYRNFWTQVVAVFTGEFLNTICKQIKSIKWAIEPPKASNGSQITPEMIDRAKNYPFENLIELNKQGFALCPFHSERVPSFYVKNNYGYCFSCGKSFDTIQFLIDKDGLKFPEAVKKLL